MPTQPGRATLVSREDLTDTLAIFRLALDAGVPEFEAGQFLTLGAERPGERTTWRAYSIASPPHETRWVELYVRRATEPVPGVLTSALWALAPGASLPHRGIAGAFTLDDTQRCILCVAAGTGIAPFVSQALDQAQRGMPRRMVVAHGASRANELAYASTFERLQDALGAARFRYVPAISRPADPANAGWSGAVGRVESLLARPQDGAPSPLEEILGEELVPDRWFALACGFDATVEAVRTALQARGFVTQRDRREDGSFDLKCEGFG